MEQGKVPTPDEGKTRCGALVLWPGSELLGQAVLQLNYGGALH